MRSRVSLIEVTGASEFMISWVRMRVRRLHVSTCVALISLSMSATATTRRRLPSSSTSEQPNVRTVSPSSLRHVARRRPPGRMSRSTAWASAAEACVWRMWVRRERPKMRSASPLTW